MQELIRILIVSLVVGLTLPALLVAILYLLPQRVLAVQTAVVQHPRRAFIVGGINVLFFGLLAAVFANGGEAGGILALLIMLLLAAMGLMGLASFTQLLRQRMYSQEGVSESLKTAVLLTAGLLTPFVGWLLMTPVLIILGIGGMLMTLFRRKEKNLDIIP